MNPAPRQTIDAIDRRRFLGRTAQGLAHIALIDLLHRDHRLRAAVPDPGTSGVDPLRPTAGRAAHFTGKAARVIVVFCSGGISQVDTWDYKPELIRRHGQPLPGGETVISFQGANGNLVRPLWPFRPRGQTGKMISDLLPNLASLADEMAFVHSLTSPTNTHGPAETFLSTGFTVEGFPSMGSWVTYALGSDNDNLPAFVAIPDPRGVPQASVNNWSAGFLPGVFQGTPFQAAKPMKHLQPPSHITPDEDRETLDFLRLLNRGHRLRHPGRTDLAARVASYEMAARMQLNVPALTRFDSEPAHIMRLYGADDQRHPVKAAFARNCILARRLVERGVRFVQLFNGAYGTAQPGDTNWDAHADIKRQFEVHAPILDRPVAGLLTDLKQRGLLDDTLVVFCTEFGRKPMFQSGTQGRDHNPEGFTCWLAGGGVKRGFSHGATDAFGHRAVEDVASVHDLHATMLHLLGLDHTRLTYRHNGRDQRLTDVEGHVIHELIA